MLESILESQEQQLNLLLSILLDERKALESNDLPLLTKIAEDKAACLDTINASDKELAEHPERNAIKQHPKRQSIEALLIEAQELNQVNGAIIAESSERVQQLSKVVHQLQNQNATTYDRLGQRSSGERLGKGFKA